MKSPTKGRKSPETPKAAPKQAKKKDTEGQAALTSKPLTMKNQRKRREKGSNPKNPYDKQQQNKQGKRKRERSKIYRQIMKKKKRRREKNNVPSKYAAQTEKIHKTATEAKLEWWHK